MLFDLSTLFFHNNKMLKGWFHVLISHKKREKLHGTSCMKVITSATTF